MKECSSRKREGVSDKALHTVASAQSGSPSEPKAESESPTQPTEGGSNPQPSPMIRKLLEDLNKQAVNLSWVENLKDRDKPWILLESVTAVLTKVQADQTMKEQALRKLLVEKRKEWKIAYPLKTKYDFQTRILIDQIFDELEKVFDETDDFLSDERTSTKKTEKKPC